MIQQKQTQVNQGQHGQCFHVKSSHVLLDSHGFPCQSKQSETDEKPAPVDYDCTPFPEVNWLIRALASDQRFIT